MRAWIVSALAVAACLAAPAAQAQTWWYLGDTADNSGLYIDADSLDVDDEGYAYYTGMFVYKALQTTASGESVRYLTFVADIDCMMGDLYEYSRAYYHEDRSLALEEKTGQSYPINAGSVADTEANFVCDVSSSWAGYGFQAVGDPVAYSRGW